MQRILQRAKRADRVATRRLKKDKAHEHAAEAWKLDQNRRRMVKENNNLIKEARRNRQMDWQAGVLAPRRDAGEKKETYGTVSVYDFSAPDVHPEHKMEWWHIREGDRVVITKGRDMGRIATVQNVLKDKNALKIKDVNTYDIVVPEWIQREEGDDRRIVPASADVPVRNVKLVYPLPDPETGVPRDVIIDQLLPVHGGEGERYRVVAGTNTIIPWPEVTEDAPEDYESDTARLSVDEQTFRPFLLHPPMPISVIDELRNKYSRFRTRHDFDFVQQREQQEERIEKRQALGKTMRTPLQELADLRTRQAKAQEKKLSREQLARIGEVIAQSRRPPVPVETVTVEPILS